MMPDVPKPSPVWISPTDIGQHFRGSQSTKTIDLSLAAGMDSLRIEIPSLAVTEGPMTAETDQPETEDKSLMAEPAVEVSNPSAVQTLASSVPLPDTDANEVEALESTEIPNQDATTPLEIDTGELTSPSKDWYSPTYSDEGMAARMWVSPRIAEHERWIAVKASLKIMELIPRSPYVPRTFAEWLTHRAEMNDIMVRCGFSWTASLKLTASLTL